MTRKFTVIVDTSTDFEYSLHKLAMDTDPETTIIYQDKPVIALQLYAQISMFPSIIVCPLEEDYSQLEFKQIIDPYIKVNGTNTLYFISKKSYDWCINIEWYTGDYEAAIVGIFTENNISISREIPQIVYDICDGSWANITSIISGIPENTFINISNLGEYFTNNERSQPYEILKLLCWSGDLQAFIYKLQRERNSKYLLYYLRKVFTNAVIEPDSKVRKAIGDRYTKSMYKSLLNARTLNDIIPKLIMLAIMIKGNHVNN